MSKLYTLTIFFSAALTKSVLQYRNSKNQHRYEKVDEIRILYSAYGAHVSKMPGIHWRNTQYSLIPSHTMAYFSGTFYTVCVCSEKSGSSNAVAQIQNDIVNG